MLKEAETMAYPLTPARDQAVMSPYSVKALGVLPRPHLHCVLLPSLPSLPFLAPQEQEPLAHSKSWVWRAGAKSGAVHMQRPDMGHPWELCDSLIHATSLPSGTLTHSNLSFPGELPAKSLK